MTIKPMLSIIIPTLNEAGNIQNIIHELDQVLSAAKISYEVIVIDDHSTDQTVANVHSESKSLPVELYIKQGKPGKAYSLLEGFAHAQSPIICMIDADLQYPPNAIVPMYEKVRTQGGVCVANRVQQQTSWKRRLMSRTFKVVFGQLLHGLTCDIQSGLKVFDAKLLKNMSLSPTAWTFDLEFLVNVRRLGQAITQQNIVFGQRLAGETKVDALQSSIEIALASLKVKFQSPQVIRASNVHLSGHPHQAPELI